MKLLELFRRLAVFGIVDRAFVLFRCVDGEYRVYDKQTKMRLNYDLTEEDAYLWFMSGRAISDVKFTYLDSPHRKAA